MCEYMELYRSSKEDEKNPYFAPLQHHDFSNLPDTLLITMEYDPLRDEGEALGEKMREAGCSIKECSCARRYSWNDASSADFLQVQRKFMRQLKASLENEDNRKTKQSK